MMDIEKLLQNRIEMDTPFAFHCLECGACCRNREDVILSAYDLYRIAKALDMTTEDVIRRYCELYIGPTSRIPLVRIMPKGDKQVCPLLRNGRCSVHKSKPVACALYPVGRALDTETDSYIYFLQPVDCAAKDKKRTLRQWLEQFGLSEFDRECKAWGKMRAELANWMQSMEKRMPDKVFALVFSAEAGALYQGYQTDQPFYEQFQHRCQMLRDLMEAVSDILNGKNPAGETGERN